MLVCVATALVTEHLCCKLMHRESTAGDLSCVVTAMLFAFTLPADCGYFPAILGTVFAVGVVKMLFGGIGCNFANPAVAGRVFIMLAMPIGCNFANPAVAGRVFIMLAMPIALGAYPDVMGTPLDAITGATPLAMNAAGAAPYSYMDMMFGLHAGALGETCIITDVMGTPLDAITGATPLAMNAAGAAPYSYMDMMFGLHAGALGETCIITLLAGYVFLLVLRVVDAWATVPFIATVAVITGIAGQDAVYQVLSGGLALGAFYMATDYTTTPMTPKGKIIFGIGCGTRPQPAGGVKHALV